jgi:hypothetical protein
MAIIIDPIDQKTKAIVIDDRVKNHQLHRNTPGSTLQWKHRTVLFGDIESDRKVKMHGVLSKDAIHLLIKLISSSTIRILPGPKGATKRTIVDLSLLRHNSSAHTICSDLSLSMED